MSILVVGGTGNVGGEVVRGLLAKGASVSVLLRSPEKAGQLPSGVKGVPGDLAHPESLGPALAGVESVFLVTVVNPGETMQGLAGVEAAKQAGVKRIVYNSVAFPPGFEKIPHFGSKLPVEEAARASGMEWTILRPNNFYQNDVFFRDAMLNYGSYPQPIGDKGVYRVDVRDLAEVGVLALTGSGHNGKTYALHGPGAWTGASTAAAWTRHLGREVRYAGNDLDAWERMSLQFMPDWLVHDFRIMYQHFQDFGFGGTPEELRQAGTLLGRPARAFDAYAAENAKEWLAART